MRLCVFCGANKGHNPAFAQAASELAIFCAMRDIPIVYGGGHVGLMGNLADAALRQGGTVIGVIPRALVEREVAHPDLTELHVVETMHERKAMMGELTDAFVALPGGFGTLEEFCEVVTWVQLGIYDRKCLLVNIDGYFDPLVAMFDRAVDEGLLNKKNRAIVTVVDSIPALIEELTNEHLVETHHKT